MVDNDGSVIVLFDGVCNLCNGLVQFIIPRDVNGLIKFASLQSEIGRKLLVHHNLSVDSIDTIVYVDSEKAYTHSTAALKIAGHLNGFWWLAKVMWLVPRSIRDIVYNWVARNRYKWFGKLDSCMMPKKEWQNRFLS